MAARIWLFLCIAAVLATAGLLFPAIVMKASNCGGNSAALAACGEYLSIVESWEADHPDKLLRRDQIDAEMRAQLSDLSGAHWIRSARMLARLDDVRIDRASAPRVLMVCDRPYDNVPEHTFWRAPPTHAVAFSNGATGLISPAQFVELDLSGFVDLRTLGETKPADPAAGPH